LPFTERSNLRKYMHSVLTNYNIFECQLEIYKQRSGIHVAMGSSLSNYLANIFGNILEKSMILKLIKSKKNLHWSRYVDDIICITEKKFHTRHF
jgi:hypothetical protein